MPNQGSTGKFTACTCVETITLDREDEQLWLMARASCRNYEEALFVFVMQLWIDGVLLGTEGPSWVRNYGGRGRAAVEFNGGRVTQCDGKLLRIIYQDTTPIVPADVQDVAVALGGACYAR